MRYYYYWLLLILMGVNSCTPVSFDEEQDVYADLAQVFTVNKQHLLDRRTTLLQQIELVATARQGDYFSLIAESKKLLAIGHSTAHLLQMTQADLLQAAKVPLAPDTLVPVAQQPYWRAYEAKLVNKKIGQQLLLEKTALGTQLIKSWQGLGVAYEELLSSWREQPTLLHVFVRFEDHPHNQLYRWAKETTPPAVLAQEHFGDLPLVILMTHLLQLETDILAQEVQLLSWLLENISRSYFMHEQFTVVAEAPTNVVLLGAPYQTKINLIAYTTEDPIEIRVNGETVSRKGGIANYETIPTTSGEQTLAIEVITSNPKTQKKEQYHHSISYHVLPQVEVK